VYERPQPREDASLGRPYRSAGSRRRRETLRTTDPDTFARDSSRLLKQSCGRCAQRLRSRPDPRAGSARELSSFRPSATARGGTRRPRLVEADSYNMSYSDFVTAVKRSGSNKLTRSNIGRSCIICDSSVDVQMHHLRQIKDLKNSLKLDFFAKSAERDRARRYA